MDDRDGRLRFFSGICAWLAQLNTAKPRPASESPSQPPFPTYEHMNNDEPTNPVAAESQAMAARAAQAWDTTKEKAGEALQTTERYVQQHPGTSVLGLFSAGLLIGVLVGWKMAHEERDSYLTNAHKFLKRWGHKLHLD